MKTAIAAKALMLVLLAVLLNTSSTTTSARTATAVKSVVLVSMAEQGICKWWNEKKGYGFIVRQNGADVFCPASSLVGATFLSEGDRVEFEVVHGPKGAIAKNVVKIS
jgi:CspA family cold shock protein